jgi:hypothetical protein
LTDWDSRWYIPKEDSGELLKKEIIEYPKPFSRRRG